MHRRASRCTPTATIVSVDPAQTSVVVATSSSCTAADADAAVAAAVAAASGWRRTPAMERAACSSGRPTGCASVATSWPRSQCFEAAKPWDQADADVCEAIDFCEYYGREVLRLAAAAADLVQSPPGEANRMTYQGKGVTVVIAPWNFPLAIPCGMTVGRAGGRQPRDPQARRADPGRGVALAEALVAAGAPPGVFQLLPGSARTSAPGSSSTPTSPSSPSPAPRPSGSRSTGSRPPPATGPAAREEGRVRAGRQERADHRRRRRPRPGRARPRRTRRSATPGRSARRRRALIVVDRVYDAVVERLVGCTRELLVGHPATPGVQVGPVIDADAHARVRGYVEAAPPRARCCSPATTSPTTGWFVGPTHRRRRRPGRADRHARRSSARCSPCCRARDFDHAIELANGTDYALTAGCFSRSPVHLDASGRGAARRQRLPQPPHHRRGRGSPALRRLRHERHRLQGRRPRLPPPVPRPPGQHREHPAPGLRTGVVARRRRRSRSIDDGLRRRRWPRRSGPATGRRRGRPWSTSSSWVPASTTAPASSTWIRSAWRTVERRWAITIVVRSADTRASERWMAASVSLSTAEVASSSTRIAGSRRIARAMVSRWRWPPESFWPRSPTIGVVAVGRALDEVVGLGERAACTRRRASVASGRP